MESEMVTDSLQGTGAIFQKGGAGLEEIWQVIVDAARSGRAS